jgi:hypothetical protein
MPPCEGWKFSERFRAKRCACPFPGVAEGNIKLDGDTLKGGDGFSFSDESIVKLSAKNHPRCCYLI